ncbi:MAG: hypothetical protein U5R49_03555 [Deltaproteobacteria bacterium]|nr:hypothetical protein [Deltaproteobacteria bacterium]
MPITSPQVSGFVIFGSLATPNERIEAESDSLSLRLRSWVGLRQEVVYYDRRDREGGIPKQSFRRLVRYALDAVFSFSYKPLRIMTGTGVCISALGFVLASFS